MGRGHTNNDVQQVAFYICTLSLNTPRVVRYVVIVYNEESVMLYKLTHTIITIPHTIQMLKYTTRIKCSSGVI